MRNQITWCHQACSLHKSKSVIDTLHSLMKITSGTSMDLFTIYTSAPTWLGRAELGFSANDPSIPESQSQSYTRPCLLYLERRMVETWCLHS